MVRLKMELHHVLEHTAALLHLRAEAASDPAASLKKLEDVFRQLAFHADTLRLSLKERSPHEIGRVLLWLQRVQGEVKVTLKALVSVVGEGEGIL